MRLLVRCTVHYSQQYVCLNRSSSESIRRRPDSAAGEDDGVGPQVLDAVHERIITPVGGSADETGALSQDSTRQICRSANGSPTAFPTRCSGGIRNLALP